MKVEKRIQALIDMGVYNLWAEEIKLQGISQNQIRRAINSERYSSSYDTDRCNIIDLAFVWSSSRQDYNFWRNISRTMYDMGF